MGRLYQSRTLHSLIREHDRQLRKVGSASILKRSGLSVPGEGVTQVDGNLSVEGNLDVQAFGRLTFPEGGSLLMQDHAGREYLYAGGYTTNGFGFTLTRLDGSAALVFTDDDPNREQTQRLGLYDRDSNALVSEDVTGAGASWPLAPIVFAGVSWPTWDGNNTSTFTTVATALTYKSSPRLYVVVNHIADAATAGQIRLMVNGVQLGSSVTVAALSMGQTTFSTPADPGGDIGDPLTLTIDARTTSGTGMVRARVVGAMQWPS